MTKPRPKRAPAGPVKPEKVPAAAPPAPPVALSPALRNSIQQLLVRLTGAAPALRTAGAFEILGLVSQAGHALKLVTEHCHTLERALGLLPDPPATPAPAPAAAPKPSSNGVPT